MVRVNRLLIVLVLAVLILSACQPIQPVAPSAASAVAKGYTPRYEPAECKYPIPESEKVECGYLTVPEDRNKPDGPMIRLHVVNFKSKSEKPKPDPIFVVHGGPADAGMIIVYFWTSDPVASTMRAERDNIYMEYRGSNYSEPAFYCPEMVGDLNAFARMSITEEEAWSVEALRACHARIAAEGWNLSAYSMLAMAHDLADLRIALGYDEVNVYGVSAGTPQTMNLMRTHPEGIRSVVLDSIWPPEVNFADEGLRSTYGAFAALFQGCAADPACNEAYPELEAVFYKVTAQLRSNPVDQAVEVEAGKPFTVTIDDSKFVNYVYSNLFNRNMAAIPAAIYAANASDYQAVASDWLSYMQKRHVESGPGSWAYTYGEYYNILCLREGTFTTIEKANTIFDKLGGDPSVREWANAYYITDTLAPCAYWNVTPPEPNIEITPMASDLPTLMLVGSFDPATPPFMSEAYGERLTNHYRYELPFGHGQILSTCGLDLIGQFFADPTKAPDASCIAEMKIDWVLPE